MFFPSFFYFSWLAWYGKIGSIYTPSLAIASQAPCMYMTFRIELRSAPRSNEKIVGVAWRGMAWRLALIRGVPEILSKMAFFAAKEDARHIARSSQLDSTTLPVRRVVVVVR